ncbi:helix-turn-helix domain-containing protein [Streptomyces sp. NPDC093510]|uniref:ArsR/SmtB family transcription factor n=1 Tax=Streptomyces sp. NPDC093510 TaxID=3155199 RepID=UPI003431F1D7
MIHIPIQKSGHSSVRISSSWLWEVFGSLGLLVSQRATPPWPYAKWAKEARRSVTAAGIEIPPWLVELYRSGRGTLPSFLAVVPTSPKADLEESLAALRALPPAHVRAGLARWYPDGVPSVVQPLNADPETALRQLSRTLDRYWQAALAPYASSLRSTIEEEILLRSRVLATEGSDRLFDTLHGRLLRDASALRIDAGPGRISVPLASRIVIVPLLFGRGASLFAMDEEGSAAFSYQAKGAAILSGTSAPDRRTDMPVRGDRLEILLGRSRAGVVRGLAVPTTTTALAAVLGLAASTVSEHLTSLVSAGLVHRRRAGTRVLYELDGSGLALLDYLDNEGVSVMDRRRPRRSAS